MEIKISFKIWFFLSMLKVFLIMSCHAQLPWSLIKIEKITSILVRYLTARSTGFRDFLTILLAARVSQTRLLRPKKVTDTLSPSFETNTTLVFRSETTYHALFRSNICGDFRRSESKILFYQLRNSRTFLSCFWLNLQATQFRPVEVQKKMAPSK